MPTDAALDHFETLTTRTFLVLDTEYTTHRGKDGKRLISVGITTVIGGKRAGRNEELDVVMNPGIAIDANSTAVHGFTDADVARRRDFAYYAPRILARLARHPDAVLVTHTGADIYRLREELARLDELRQTGDTTITVGLADLPELRLIDTSTLPRLLRLPGLGARPVIGLDDLSSMLGVSATKRHTALGDARTAADVLVKLLLHAAQHFTHGTLDELLDDHARGTTHDPHVPVAAAVAGFSEPRLPDEHLVLHQAPLLDRATAADVDLFVAMARECVRLRCPHLLEAADLAATNNADLLLNPVADLLTAPDETSSEPAEQNPPDEPGRAGTAAGALLRVLDPTSPGTPALASQEALSWWRRRSSTVSMATRCASSGAAACPDCRAGRECALDVLHRPIASTATYAGRADLDADYIKDRLMTPMATKSWRALTGWKDDRCRAWMAWLVVAWWRGAGHERTYRTLLELARSHDLHLVEPRLALLACEQDAAAGAVTDAMDLARQLLVDATTDRGYADLREWLTWQETEVAVASKKTYTAYQRRRMRPTDRRNANPYAPI